MSKTLAQLAARHPDKIAGYYHDSDGWWIDLKTGWQAESCSEVHQIHEQTAAQAARAFREVVPCDCRECRGEPDPDAPPPCKHGAVGHCWTCFYEENPELARWHEWSNMYSGQW